MAIKKHFPPRLLPRELILAQKSSLLKRQDGKFCGPLNLLLQLLTLFSAAEFSVFLDIFGCILTAPLLLHKCVGPPHYRPARKKELQQRNSKQFWDQSRQSGHKNGKEWRPIVRVSGTFAQKELSSRSIQAAALTYRILGAITCVQEK